jgi:hypothetical protein
MIKKLLILLFKYTAFDSILYIVTLKQETMRHTVN